MRVSGVLRYYPRVFDEFVRAIPDEVEGHDGIDVPAINAGGRVERSRVLRDEKEAESYYRVSNKRWYM